MYLLDHDFPCDNIIYGTKFFFLIFLLDFVYKHPILLINSKKIFFLEIFIKFELKG